MEENGQFDGSSNELGSPDEFGASSHKFGQTTTTSLGEINETATEAKTQISNKANEIKTTDELAEHYCDLRLTLICFKTLDRLLDYLKLLRPKSKADSQFSFGQKLATTNVAGNVFGLKHAHKSTSLKKEFKKATSNKFFKEFRKESGDGLKKKFQALQNIRNALAHNPAADTFEDIVQKAAIPVEDRSRNAQPLRSGLEMKRMFLDYYYEILGELMQRLGEKRASVNLIKPAIPCLLKGGYKLMEKEVEKNDNETNKMKDENIKNEPFCCDCSLAVRRAKMLEARLGIEFEVEDGEGLSACVQFLCQKYPHSQLYRVQMGDVIDKVAHTRNVLVHKDFDQFEELPTVAGHQKRHGNAISFSDYKWFDKKLLDKEQFIESCDKLEKLLLWHTVGGESSATPDDLKNIRIVNPPKEKIQERKQDSGGKKKKPLPHLQKKKPGPVDPWAKLGSGNILGSSNTVQEEEKKEEEEEEEMTTKEKNETVVEPNQNETDIVTIVGPQPNVPMTTIQFQLSGTKFQKDVNVQVTISQLYTFVKTFIPPSIISFELLHGRPPKPLPSSSLETIRQSGLERSQLIIKIL